MLDFVLELAAGWLDVPGSGKRRLRRYRRRLAKGGSVRIPGHLLVGAEKARRGHVLIGPDGARWQDDRSEVALPGEPVEVRITSRAERRRGVPFLHRVIAFPGGREIAVGEHEAELFRR